MSGVPAITLLTLAPIVGAIVVLMLRNSNGRSVAIGASLVPLVLSMILWRQFDLLEMDLQFVERHQWIPSLGVEYFVGLDGLSLMLVLLTGIVVPFALAAAPAPAEKPRLFYGLFLLLQAGLYGTFTALNFFHWFLFWEAALLPAFFLIKFWGGPGRTPAAYQFFVYTLAGSVPMLIGFLALHAATGTFDFIRLAEIAREGGIQAALAERPGWGTAVFIGILLGFAVKVPMIPLHTWLPPAYVEAPTNVSMVLTGVMSKMGVYGLLRILLPIFPEQIGAMLTPLLWLAVATIVLSAFAALAQRDLKRVIAYSSINHLGYCLLGVFAAAAPIGETPGLAFEKVAALNGVMLQMFNHGLTAAALFCFAGFLERRSGGLRGLDDFGGLRMAAPVFCGLMGITLFSSLGLPGLNSFVGEFLIFKGVFPLAPWAAAGSALGLLLTAAVMLTVLHRVFNGPLNERWKKLPDLTLRERLVVLPAVGLMFGLGIYPQILVEVINPAALALVEQLRF